MFRSPLARVVAPFGRAIQQRSTIMVRSPMLCSSKRFFAPDARGGAEALNISVREFDADAAEFVPKEVSIFDRGQTNLTQQQRDAAKLYDYDGDEKSAPFSTGASHPAPDLNHLKPPSSEFDAEPSSSRMSNSESISQTHAEQLQQSQSEAADESVAADKEAWDSKSDHSE